LRALRAVVTASGPPRSGSGQREDPDGQGVVSSAFTSSLRYMVELARSLSKGLFSGCCGLALLEEERDHDADDVQPQHRDAITICDIMSVPGLITAATMKMIRNAYLKYFSRNCPVTTPIRARKNTSVGISHTAPDPRIIFV
jgi:hypothetical protein